MKKLDLRLLKPGLVTANASSNLDLALSTGHSAYDSSAISVIYASARNQNTMSLLLPSILELVGPIVDNAAAEHTAGFLSAAAGNQTAISTAAKCPQCLAAPYAIGQTDLIPFNIAAGTAPTTVGQIFVCRRAPEHMSDIVTSDNETCSFLLLPSPSSLFSGPVLL